MDNLELLIGLLAIALAVFFGLWGFRKDIIKDLSAIKEAVKDLSSIKEAVVAIKVTTEKTWELVLRRSGESGGTVERNFKNLGKVKISAEPSVNQTSYLLEIEKPTLKDGLLTKKFKEHEFLKVEKELLGDEGTFYVLPGNRLRYTLPSTDPKACTKFISFMLDQLDSTYLTLLEGIKEYEEPIIT